jgi:SAM-dependent methyltransferase
MSPPDSQARRASRRLLQRLGLFGAARFVRGVRAVELEKHLRARLARRNGAPPLPGPARMFSVAGTADVDWFLSSGRAGADSIAQTLSAAGAELAELRSILDFGCGCGRVLRHFAPLAAAPDGPRLVGSDLNRRSVRWCRRHLPFAEFTVNPLAPPLPFEDARFELVYALSVFTHMPPALQQRWMAELRRVLEPGGWLMMTTHGESYLSHLSPAEQARFRAGETVVRYEDVAGSNLCGAYHPPAVVAELARGFEVICHQPEGAHGNPHQDLFLLRRLGSDPPEGAALTDEL